MELAKCRVRVSEENKRARLEGIEPPTRCLEGSCSIP